MDYAKIAEQVIQYVGGKKNIKSVAHCATRLRFQLRDNSLRNEEALSDLEGVKGVFLTQSQFQIIFGSGTVNLVCAEVQKQLGTLEEQASNEKEEKSGNAIQRFIKMLSDIFVPIIPAIVAGGLLMGLNNVLTSPLINGSSVIELYPQWAGLATAVNTFASAPFTFLPVLIGFSATKKFGGNAFLGAAMGMIMVHPDLLNAYQIGIADPPVWNILGLNVAAIGYQGTVLPVLAVSWIIANIEKRLRKVTPSWLDNLTTPLLSILEPIANVLGTIVGWVSKIVGFGSGVISKIAGLFGGGGGSASVSGYATGGFTRGPSIAGEDPRYPTEAVISFNPAYRSQNLSYWAEAGRMLGASDGESDYELLSGGSGTAVVYDLSGLSFSPQIKVEGDTDEDALIRKLRDLEPEFIDFILEALSRREGGAYVTADSRLY